MTYVVAWAAIKKIRMQTEMLDICMIVICEFVKNAQFTKNLEKQLSNWPSYTHYFFF